VLNIKITKELKRSEKAGGKEKSLARKIAPRGSKYPVFVAKSARTDTGIEEIARFFTIGLTSAKLQLPGAVVRLAA
jgi:hypothetical protein